MVGGVMVFVNVGRASLQYDSCEDYDVTLSTRVLTLMLVLLPSMAQAADFRGSSWGDSPDQVAANETAILHHRNADEIAFLDSSIEGIDGGVIYLFDDGRLVQVVHVSRREYTRGEGVLDDFERMRSHYAEILGAEGERELRWINDSLRDQPERLAEAISKEHVRFSHSWSTDRSRVELLLTGKDGGVQIRVVFMPAG
jgi:hypothetical protein